MRADWLAISSVYIRGQDTLAENRSKIFYKTNIKGLIVSLYCDVNTLEAVEHSSNMQEKRHSATPQVPKLASLLLYSTQRVCITAREMRARFIFLKYMRTSAIENTKLLWLKYQPAIGKIMYINHT